MFDWAWNQNGMPNYKLYLASVATLIFSFLLFLLAVKIYNYFTTQWCYSKNTLAGKTVIVTGANGGIGKETALDLAFRQARVIMACRNIHTAEKVREHIISVTKNKNVIVEKLDLCSLKSVREFAEKINRTEERLDVLIHNAGVWNLFRKNVTEDGLEATMATNHFGPFLLTHLLIDLLKKSAPSRVVVVSSFAHRLACIDLDNINPVKGFPYYLYFVSKRANVFFTLELARRLAGTGVTANCLHPGFIDTNLWNHIPFPLNLFSMLIAKTCYKSPKCGAQTSIYCAVSQQLCVTSGKYFTECEETKLSDKVQDPVFGKKYWELCEKLVLKPDDPRI